MPILPDPVAISSTAPGTAPGTTAVTEITAQSDGAIAFRERLQGAINAAQKTVTAESSLNNSVGAAGAMSDFGGSSAIPLYDRLYGTQSVTRPAIAGVGEPSSTANPAALRKIQNFANAIRTPASIAALELGTSTNTVIAFAGLETGWGQHIPGRGDSSSNNLFGIKAHGDSQPSVRNATTEYIDGEAQTYDQQFRSYQSIGDSIADFSRFLRSNPRYHQALIHADNPETFIKLVHEAGYATDPNYADKVIGALQQLDKITTKTGAIGFGWR